MKKKLFSLIIALCVIFSTVAPCLVAAQEASASLLSGSSEEGTLPAVQTLPLSLLVHAENAKSAVIQRGTFDFSDTVSVMKYSGDDMANVALENNVFSITSTKPGIYTNQYRYVEIVYYYGTTQSFTAVGQEMRFTLGFAADENGTKTSWMGKTISSGTPIIANQWDRQVIDLSALETLAPAAFADGYSYEHIRINPFGSLTAGSLTNDDIVYIKAVNFYRDDPRVQQTGTIRYYDTAAKAQAGLDDFLFEDTLTEDTYGTLRTYTNEVGQDIIRWQTANGQSYTPGAGILCDFNGVLNLYGIPSTDTVVYITPSGYLNNIDPNSVHTAFNTAIAAIGDNNGTIYVSGEITLPAVIGDEDDITSGTITIRGYSGTSDKVRIPSGGMEIYRNLTFDNITVKAQMYDERWIAVMAALNIKGTCVVERGDPYTTSSGGTATSGLYLARDFASQSNAHITLSSPTGYYAMVAPAGLYGSASYVTKGELTFDLNDGTFGTVYGGVRNGNAGASAFQRVEGDISFHINGGSFTGLYTGNVTGGFSDSNVIFTINGGTFSSKSKMVFGNSSTGYAGKSSMKNAAVIVNAQKLAENNSNSSLLTVASCADFGSYPKEESILVLNHAEYSDYLPNITAFGLTYKLRVTGGEAYPVFAKRTASGGSGDFLGFEIVGDTPQLSPYVGSARLLRNENGYYTLPSGDTFTDVTFQNDLAGQYFTASFERNGGSGTADPLTAEGNTAIQLPSGLAREGYYFAGWEKDGVRYAAGADYYIQENSCFTAVWVPQSGIVSLYVNAETGSDSNPGVSPYAPLNSFAKALETADSLGVTKIILMTQVTAGISTISSSTARLTITARDNSTQYDGAFINTSPLNVRRPVTFEYMGMGSSPYSFVNTENSHVIFGKGLTKAAGTNGIYLHMGKEGAASPSVNTEIHSGSFAVMYLGGAYLAQDSVGVSGDVTFTTSVTLPSLAFGFDGYTGHAGTGSIGGSAVFYMKGGSISRLSTLRLGSIAGSLYVICSDEAPLPADSLYPQAENGNYILRAGEGGTVTPAYNADGSVRAGYIRALAESENYKVKLLSASGLESVYDPGDISLLPGSYTVDFIECETVTSCDFNITPPFLGHTAETKEFSSGAYIAKAVWYKGNTLADVFKANTDYTLKITLRPLSYADMSGLTSITVNGTEVPFSVNSDGSFTATMEYPAGEGTLNSKYIKYVSSTGNDTTNSGSQSYPYATLNKALSALAATGGTVYVSGSVIGSGTYPANTYPILISGKGSPNAKLTLAQNEAVVLRGDIRYEDLTITAGNASHFNDRGNSLVFGDGVILNGKMLHAGAYNSGNTAPSIASSHITIGGNSSFGSVNVGGGYLTNGADGIAGDISLTLNGGIISRLSLGPDAYLAKHTGCTLGGNLLVTVNGGHINRVDNSIRPLYTGEDTVYQFIFNNGTGPLCSVSETVIPSTKLYTVYSDVGGQVSHALDAQGSSLPGQFDILPDDGYTALVKYNGYTALTSGGRYRFPANCDVYVSYIKSSYPLETFVIELNGGKAVSNMLEIAEDGTIHFGNAPQKDNFLFEGWYQDKELTTVVCDGDYVGANCQLYAKYYELSRETDDHVFTVKGIQMRLPLEEGVTQALRFVMEVSQTALNDIATFSDKNSPYIMETGIPAAEDFTSNNTAWQLSNANHPETGYGATVLPTEKLNGRELLLDTSYSYNGKNYKSKDVPALLLYGHEDNIQRYTLCVTGITQDKYEYSYSVRPYIRYYSRSGSLCVAYGNPYSANVYQAAVAALEGGMESQEANTYLRSEICQVFAEKHGIEFIPEEVLSQVKQRTESLKSDVLNSENPVVSSFTGTVYYVSNDGSDSNSGTSPSSPWATISKVNSASLISGDAVLFRRGDEFRGHITGKAGVTYSAYGTGDKPIINGSARNYADPSLWSETALPNVYKLNDVISNVGIIAFNHTGEIGKYDELVGDMRVCGVDYDGKTFYNQNQLNKDLQFYSNLNTNELFLYSTKGNPGSRFSSIEIGNKKNLLSPASGVTVDNLHFRYTGGHGVGGGGGFARYDGNGNYLGITGCTDLTVTNCLFAWIGGSILNGFGGGDTTRYGNAVEIYGSVDGYTVENNWIYQIYDTAITHQCGGQTVGNTMMKDILYRHNLVEYCHWSIEFYNAPCGDGYSRITKDVLVEDNVIRMGGYGWGSVPRKSGATLYNSFGLSDIAEETQNFEARNNVFFRSTGPIFRLNAYASERNLTFDGNLYIQDYGNQLAYYCGTTYLYDGNAASRIEEGNSGSIIHETNSKGVYYYLP